MRIMGETTRTSKIRRRARRYFGLPAVVVPTCVGAESGPGRQPVRAHGVENSRGFFRRQHHLHRPDAGRISLGRDSLRLVSLRWRPDRPLAATAGSASPLHHIRSLVAARDGTLWIGTSNGLASWKNGKLTQYAELAGLVINALVEDDEGSIWAGTNGPADGKLCEIRNGNVRCHPEVGDVGHGVLGLYKDGKGNLWVELETGVWRWRPGPPKFYAVPGILNGRMQGMADGEDGALLIATTGAVMRLADGKAEVVYPLPAARPGFSRLRMLRDRDGGLWVAPASRGIVHIHQGRTDVFSELDGLSGDDIYDLFEDREGNIWVATVNGLDRFRELPVVTYSRNQGLSDIPWGGVLAARDGSVWFAALDGLNRLNQGKVTVYRQHRARTGVREIVGSGLPEEGVGSLFQDSRGRIWVSTLTGIGYLKNDQFIPTAAPGGVVVPLRKTVQGICGSPTATAVSSDCRRVMSLKRFHGPHSDARILRLFWPRILCTAAYGSDFLRVASSGSVTVMSSHPTRPPMGWARVVSISFGSTGKERFGSPLRADSAD